MDSKPEVMDRLDRRLIQLQIEREAVRREKDEASQKRLALIEEEIARLQKEIADYDEIWQAEKAQAQGSAHVREEIDKLKFQIEEFTSKGDFNKVAELQYGKLPGAGEAPEGSAGHRSQQGQVQRAHAAAHAGRRRGNRRGRGARHRHPGLQADAGRARQAAA